jgi:hypothetical protein
MVPGLRHNNRAGLAEIGGQVPAAGGDPQSKHPWAGSRDAGQELEIHSAHSSEKDAKLAQKLGQLQPFKAVFLQECMGQLASFGPT